MKNIVLVGFMGTGKSSVGELLARMLKRKFVGTDERIEQREKRSITEIFETSGEPYFRKAEKNVIREVASLDGMIIAAGGGAVIDEENVRNLKKNGIIVCLSATPEVICERTGKYKHRPLLNVADSVARIKELLAARAPFYRTADYQIDTSGKSVARVAEEIVSLVGTDGAG